VAVGVVLVLFALLVAATSQVLSVGLPSHVLSWLCYALALGLFARAVGDFRYVGFFKKVRGSRFARMDTFLYSPLCLMLSLGVTVVAIQTAWAGHMDGMASQARQPEPPALKQVAPDLHFFYHDASSNSAFLVTDAGVLVIDAGQHPADGRALLQRIRKVTDQPVKWLINTHAHGDHYLGNPAFREAGATIVAHRDTATMMKTHYEYEIGRRGAYYKRNNLDPKELALALPDVVFDSSMTITLGNRVVQVMYLGAGQNPGDTVVLFPHARTLFVGGPFARQNWSNTTFTPSVDGWIALLNRLAAMDVDRYLPGHGDVGSRQDLLDEAKWLANFQAGIKNAMAQGMGKEEMVQKLHFREYQHLRNYPLMHNFIEALHHLYTTGKPVIALPESR
jgi:glyoxylase-like metal-dependent hydrolase (beta-lactamase superfamily II)